MLTSASAPWEAAIPSAVRVILSCSNVRVSGLSDRIVPIIKTESGMMLPRFPPSICPIVTIAGESVRSTWRLTMVWRPTTIWDAATIGSTPPPRHGAMGLSAPHDDSEAVRARKHSARPVHDGPHRGGEYVQSENGFGSRVFKGAIRDHGRGSARAFFSRLEQELHGAGKVVAHLRQNAGHTHEDGHVVVMTTCVHDAHLPALPHGLDLRREREVHLLGYGQPIHVRSERDDRPRAPATKHTHNSCSADTRLDLDTERFEMLGHKSGSAELLHPEFGVRVNVPAPYDDLVVHGPRPGDRLQREGLGRSSIQMTGWRPERTSTT